MATAFQSPVNYVANCGPDAVVVGAFNGDGMLDVLVATAAGVSLLFGNGNGTLQPATSFPVSGQTALLAVGDFTGKGNSMWPPLAEQGSACT
jgi:hypothetical protein